MVKELDKGISGTFYCKTSQGCYLQLESSAIARYSVAVSARH